MTNSYVVSNCFYEFKSAVPRHRHRQRFERTTCTCVFPVFDGRWYRWPDARGVDCGDVQLLRANV